MGSPLGPRQKPYTIQLHPTAMMATTTATMSDPLRPDHDPNYALQKYLLLHSQHEFLLQHLDEIRPLPSSTATASAVSSPSASPTRSSPHRPRRHTPRQHARRSSLPGPPSSRDCLRKSACLETVVDETTLHQVAAGEQELFDVNEGIKRALTELLNCEMVRSDQTLRTWVQCRLMDTERELRSSRRRRSAGGLD
jgi:hypothetical protein